MSLTSGPAATRPTVTRAQAVPVTVSTIKATLRTTISPSTTPGDQPQRRGVGVAPHQRAVAGQHDEGDQGERDADAEQDLTEHQRPGRVPGQPQHDQGRDQGDRPAGEQGNADVQQAGHNRGSGVAADRGGRQSGGQQTDPEGDPDAGAEGRGDRGVGTLDAVGALLAAQARRGEQQHGDVDRAGDDQGRDHVDPGGPEQPSQADALEIRAVPVPGQGGVHVDSVRHHRGAEHARREQHRRRAGEPRDQAGRGVGPGHRADEQAGDETHGDDGQQSDHHELERPLAAPRLHREQQHRDDANDQAAEQQRDVEEDLQRDRPADHLGQVGGGGDELGLRPVQQPDRPGGEPGAEDLRQARAGHQTELGREVLHQHRHSVGGDQHPDQQIAVLRAGGEVGRDVAWVDVSDRGHERRSQQLQQGGAARRPRIRGRGCGGRPGAHES